MNKTEITSWRNWAHLALARIRARQRAIDVLFSSGLEADAREILAASFSELFDIGKALLEVAGPSSANQAELAAGRLRRLELAAKGLREETVADFDELIDIGKWSLESLERLLAALETGELRTFRDRRRKVIFVAVGLATFVFLSAGLVLGPSALGRWQRDRDAKRTLITYEILTELASMSLNAKKASGKTLILLTGETCTECDCGDSKQLRELYKYDPCLVRWRKAVSAIFKAATGKKDVPDRFLFDPWGAPFALNENEGETKGECLPDVIRSAGPDGVLNTADDIRINVPTAFCKEPE